MQKKSWPSGLYIFPTKNYFYHLISLFASILPFSFKTHGKGLQKGFETNGQIPHVQSKVHSKGSGDRTIRKCLREEGALIMQEINLTQRAWALLQNTKWLPGWSTIPTAPGDDSSKSCHLNPFTSEVSSLSSKAGYPHGFQRLMNCG